MKRSFLEKSGFFLFLMILFVQLSSAVCERALAGQLSAASLEEDTFREMQLSGKVILDLDKLSAQAGISRGDVLTVLHTAGNGTPGQAKKLFSRDELIAWKHFLTRYNEAGYKKIQSAYEAVWDDLVCFPVAEDGMVYENSWMFERTYGGLRGHEGTDIMPPQNLREYYRVVSMTDGIVEKVGWLPRGGYRIGIRASHGGYFYYAHLSSYSRAYQEGDTVEAGEVLGRMGDTGYGKEGTTGQFAVHLHLGIYISTENSGECSVNPYWILRFLQ